MTVLERAEFVRQTAHNLGFDAVEIAQASAMAPEMQLYKEWIERGYHGVMGYMERRQDEREQPNLVLKDVKSVIVLAKNYYTPIKHQETNGKIARYAWGDDYHDVLPGLLEKLCTEIQHTFADATTKWYVDTGPVLEKQWAVRAGLGWQGKHSNVIRRDIGSWFFLSVVYTSLELAYSEPMLDYCGTCTACIDACPTKAIVEPYVVDSNKCISHWTIEAKPQHEIPNEVAQQLDGWLFGCDVCQDVCPWNRFAQPSAEPRFLPRMGRTGLQPEQVVNLQEEDFLEQARQSPLKRPKLAGLQRTANALIYNITTEKKLEQE